MLEDPGNLATLQTNSELGSKHALAAAPVQNEDDLFACFQKKTSYLVCTGFPYLCIKAPRTEIAFVLVFIDFLFFVCVFIVCPMLFMCLNVADVFFFNNIGFAKIVLMQGFP